MDVSFLVLETYLLVATLTGFAVMSFDRRLAESGGRRISQGRLLLLALLGGWAGVKLAQQFSRRKTHRRDFRLALDLVPLAQVAAVAAILALPQGWSAGGSPARLALDGPAADGAVLR